MMEDEIISVVATPCSCRHKCVLGNPNMGRCPRNICRRTKKMVIMYYCKICQKITWHINNVCVHCRARAMGINVGRKPDGRR